jgi:hypothetical protein
VAKVCVLFVVKVNVSFLSSFTTRVPVRPVTATLIVSFAVFVVHVAVTVMFEVMVPVALLLNVQVWPAG